LCVFQGWHDLSRLLPGIFEPAPPFKVRGLRRADGAQFVGLRGYGDCAKIDVPAAAGQVLREH